MANGRLDMHHDRHQTLGMFPARYLGPDTSTGYWLPLSPAPGHRNGDSTIRCEIWMEKMGVVNESQVRR